MADPSVQSVLDSLKPFGVDTTWLKYYLNTLSGDAQKAALQAVQDKIDGSTVSSANDLNTAAHYAVDQYHRGQDPVSRLEHAGTLGILPGQTHTAWTDSQIQGLRKYFASDPVLKNNTDAQNKIVDSLSKNAGAGDLVATAKSLNWQSLSTEQKAQYGYQQGDMTIEGLKQLLSAKPGGSAAGKPLLDYIQSLDKTTQYVVLQNLNSSAATLGLSQKSFPLDTAQVGRMISQSERSAKNSQQTQQQTGTGTSSAATPAPGTAPPGSILNISMLTPQQGSTTVSDQQKQWYQELTGQNFDQSYQNFTKNYAIGVQQQSAVTGAGQGQEQLWNNGGFNLTQGYSASPVPIPAGAHPGQYSVSEAQFMGMQSQGALKMAIDLEQQARLMFAQEYGGQVMPSGLARQLWEKMKSIPVATLYTMAKQGTQPSSGGSVFGGLIDLDTEFTSYVAQHPELKLQTSGQDATTKALNASRQPSPIPGMTMGVYQQAIKNMQPAWEQYFRREPTTEEIQKYGGWQANDIQSWVLDQKSLDNPTMTNGQRDGYTKFSDSISQKLWGTNTDSRTVDLMHKMLTKDAISK